MVYRLVWLVLLAAALVLCASAPLMADDKEDKDTHEGKFVSADGDKFTMTEKDDEGEHTHTLAPDGKVIGPDGKECRLKDLKKGQLIRVTTKQGDPKTAVRVEAIRRKG